MFITANYIRPIREILKQRGYKSSGQAYSEKGIFVMKGPDTKVLVFPQIFDPIKALDDQISAFFKKLHDIINKQSAQEVIFQGGGDIEIPNWFLEFCKQNEIKIKLINKENYLDYA